MSAWCGEGARTGRASKSDGPPGYPLGQCQPGVEKEHGQAEQVSLMDPQATHWVSVSLVWRKGNRQEGAVWGVRPRSSEVLPA